MYLNEILKKEKISVEENEYNVFQYGPINLSDIKSPGDFNNMDYQAEYEMSDYSFSKTTYTVYKIKKPFFNKELSETELIEFFEDLVKKYENK